MKIFLDTSSLFKLYHNELNSEAIENIFTNYTVTEVFLSELSKIEFFSAVWKKVRTQDITEAQAKAITEAFEVDFSKYTFIQIDNLIVERARKFIQKYGRQGLRSLDSIQLSTAVQIETQADLFVSSDELLSLFLKEENLPTDKPKH